MDVVTLLQVAVALLLLGALASLACARRRRLAGWVGFGFVAAASLPLVVVIGEALSGAAAGETTLLRIPSMEARLAVAVDPLSAVFLAIAVVIALLSTLYSVEYMAHYERDGVGKFYPVLLVFFAAIVGVLVTTDLLFFLVFWELMTLASFFLVIFERESKASQRAGLKYFVITHAATLCLVAAILVLWRQGGSFGFAAVGDAVSGLLMERPLVAHLVLALLFLAFATKAGLLPMGDWLPDAHPAAPSGVSAALSGALVKLGVYGLVRVFAGFLPVSSASVAWGTVLAVAGTVSLFVGTLTALRQVDTKRLMAFHTIGQIGYVCLGIGVGVTCLREAPALAVLGLAGGLLHAVNHACFKACLFLGAGAVLFRTGERNMDRLAGAGSGMLVTRGSMTVASLAIAGVPPLNGFASKWLIVCSCLLAGMRLPFFLILGLVAMFISLATLASFVKVLGGVFYGGASGGATVKEAPVSMRLPQVALAGLCVLFGILPQLPLAAVRAAVGGLLPDLDLSSLVLSTSAGALSLASAGVAVATWAPLVVTLGLLLLGAGCYVVQRAGAAATRDVPPWTCGEEVSAAEARYPASSLYLPFKHAFGSVYPSVTTRVPRFPARLRQAFDVDAWLYGPAARGTERTARWVSRSHTGAPQLYVLWIVLGAVAVLGVLLLTLL